MKYNDINDDMQVEANSNGLIVEDQMLRKYFGIEYKENLGDVLKQFTKQLGKVIPKSIPGNVTDIEKKTMVNSISISDSEDPNKIYCNKVKRNPDGGQRSQLLLC